VNPEVRFPPEDLVRQLRDVETQPVVVHEVLPLTAAAWACIGGAVGVVVWTFISTVAGQPVGLVSLAIGWFVASGARRGGHGRTVQIVAAVVATLSYLAGLFGVSAGLALTQYTDVDPMLVTLSIFGQLVVSTFTGLGVINLGIVVWMAWRGTA
jgi:hypothetical protein